MTTTITDSATRRVTSLLCLSFLLMGSFLLLSGPLVASASDSTSAPQFQLLINARPPVLPADSGTYGALVLEFVSTATQQPVVPSENITIYLTSSNLLVGNVPASVTFPAGSLYYVANFTTTCCSGTTTVTAMSNNTMPSIPGQTVVETENVAGMPYKLQVYMAPKTMPASSTLTSSVIVQVQDYYGNPVTLSNNTYVALSSSNTTVGSTPTSLTIPRGGSFAQATFSATNVPGSTVITAHVDGLQPGYFATSTYTAGAPTALSVQVAPQSVISNGQTYDNLITIQLVDQEGLPSIASSNTQVNVTSTSLSACHLGTETIDIASGSSYTSIDFDSTTNPCTVEVVASAPGFASGNTTFSLVPAAASSLRMYAFPDTILASGAEEENLIAVQLQDSAGHPAMSSADVYVELGASSLGTGVVEPSLLISPGQTFGTVYFDTTTDGGSVNLTAIASGFNSTALTLSSIAVLSNDLNVTVINPHPSIVTNYTTSFSIHVTSNGAGVSDASINWVVPSGAGTLTVKPLTTNATGYATATFISGMQAGSYAIQANVTKSGYTGVVSSVDFSVAQRSTPPPITKPANSDPLFMMIGNVLPLWAIIPIAGGAGGAGFFFFRRFRAGAGYTYEDE